MFSPHLVIKQCIPKLLISFSHRIDVDVIFFSKKKYNQNIKNKKNKKIGVKQIERPKAQRKIKDQSKIKFLGNQEIKKKMTKKFVYKF